MAIRPTTPPSLDVLVDQMFSQVFEASERADLLVWIHEWEEAHPSVDNAHRITGWIDVAYAFQARKDGREEIHNPVRRSLWSFSLVNPESASA